MHREAVVVPGHNERVAATPLDQPALGYPPERPASAPLVDGHGRECMVRFRDGTERRCWADKWQRDGDGWRIQLRWGVSGEWFSEWYVYDPAKVQGTGD